MKRLLLTLLVLMVTGAQLLFGQLAGSAHDFSAVGWNTTGEVCVVCHTPHNADATITNAPLWNHESTVAVFTLYSSATMDAVVGQPDASSKLCLSCHDGTVALDNFGGTTDGTNFISGGSNVGTDLSDDHPISFTYDAALATLDGGLHDPITTSSGLTGTIDEDMLIGGQVQCSSCHDVHNESNIAMLLKKSNAASALCLTCHDK